MDKCLTIMEWVDSSGVQSGWQFLEDFQTELVHVTSVGFVIKETDEFIALAQNYGVETTNSPEQINGVITIPKAAILSTSSVPISFCQALVSKPTPQQI